MRRTSLAWALSGLFLLIGACSDDTVAPPKDTGPKKDKGIKIEASVDDQGPVLDQPVTKIDGPVTKIDGPVTKVDLKVDAPKTDAKVDAPKTDGPKVDGPKTDLAKVDGPKGDLPPAPASTKCATPEALTWTGTTIVKNGDNSNATNEYTGVNCGLTSGDFDGGQLYYKVTFAANKKYKAILLSPGADLALYAYPAATACGLATIQTACTSPSPANPDKVYVSDNIGSGVGETIRIATGAAAEDWIIVVDSYYNSASGRGPFTLTVTEIVAAANSTCATAKALTLAGTPKKVVETGDTDGAADQFATIDCGGNTNGPWPGAQLYYKVTLEGGKKYKATLTAGFDSALYAFPSATACTATAINTACTSPTPADPTNIWNDDLNGTGETIMIAPPASPTTVEWMIVVDSWAAGAKGSFTLTVAEFTPPTNATCAAPKALTLTGTPKKVVETGDTDGATDQFPTIDCGGNPGGPWPGPQLYYKVTLEGGKKYKVSLDAGTVDSALYAFPSATACTASGINTACKSPASDPLNVWNADIGSGSGESLLIAPPASPATVDWTIVVDSWSGTAKGPFTLTVAEYTPAANGLCATPETIALTTSPAIKTADSSLGPNQFGQSITCATSSTPNYDGNQLYYKVTLQNGKLYTFLLTPTGNWDPTIYAFTDTTCTVATINTQCANAVKDDGFDGDPETLEITPAGTTGTTDYIFVVDSYLANSGGAFTLKISWP